MVFHDFPGSFHTILCAFSRTFEDHLCLFSMSFQDCLIEWIPNKSDFHIHILNKLPSVGKANTFQLTIHGSEMWQPLCLFSTTFQDLGHNFPSLENLNFKFHDFPGSVHTLINARNGRHLSAVKIIKNASNKTHAAQSSSLHKVHAVTYCKANCQQCCFFTFPS